MNTTITVDRPWTRTWNPLADPNLPLRERHRGPWLVEGDLFEGVILTNGRVISGKEIDRVYAVMALCLGSTFLVPTEFPDRAWDYFDKHYTRHKVAAIASEYSGTRDGPMGTCDMAVCDAPWPLRNVIPAVVLRTQLDADRLLPDLLRVSVGPLGRMVVLRPTEAIDFSRYLSCPVCEGTGEIVESHDFCDEHISCVCQGEKPIGWVALKSLPYGYDLGDWERSYPGKIIRWCKEAGVPFWCGPTVEGEVVREFPKGVTIDG